MAVKGSGGDLRSIGVERLRHPVSRQARSARSRAIAARRTRTRWSASIRCARSARTASRRRSIRALHAFLPFPHVDHLHPDWAIALAASANGAHKLEEFNRKYGRNIAWVPWQRPGFELALMLKRAVEARPGCDGIILGGHGLFTWGDDPARVLRQQHHAPSIRWGEFIEEHARARQPAACSAAPAVTGVVADRERGRGRPLPVPARRRLVEPPGHRRTSTAPTTRSRSPTRTWAEELCGLGTSCPDHFLRTRISPMFIPWDPATEDAAAITQRIAERIAQVSRRLRRVLQGVRRAGSPALRDSNPSVVVIPGLGLFGFGKDKREARITSEFFVNAIHVMQGANALEDGDGRSSRGPVPQVAAPGAGEGVQGLPQLRRAAAARGVPDRVLGARRSQAAADAAREGVQPQGRGRRRRRQRHRPRSGAADRQARRPRRGRRSRTRPRPPRRRRRRRSCRRRRWCRRRRST